MVTITVLALFASSGLVAAIPGGGWESTSSWWAKPTETCWEWSTCEAVWTRQVLLDMMLRGQDIY